MFLYHKVNVQSFLSALFLIDSIDYRYSEYFRICKHCVYPRIVFFVPQKAANNSNVLPFYLPNAHTRNDLEASESQKLDSLAYCVRKRFAQSTAFDGIVLHILQRRRKRFVQDFLHFAYMKSLVRLHFEGVFAVDFLMKCVQLARYNARDGNHAGSTVSLNWKPDLEQT